jgi:hypothetical protein
MQDELAGGGDPVVMPAANMPPYSTAFRRDGVSGLVLFHHPAHLKSHVVEHGFFVAQ